MKSTDSGRFPWFLNTHQLFLCCESQTNNTYFIYCLHLTTELTSGRDGQALDWTRQAKWSDQIFLAVRINL